MSAYTIKLAVTNPAGLGPTATAAMLQAVFDSGCVAGQFNVDLVGTSIAVVTFQRDIRQDCAATDYPIEKVTMAWAIGQLRREFTLAASDDLAEQHLLRQVINALSTHDCTVEGLPCQRPRLRLYLDVAYAKVADRDAVAKSLTGTTLEALVMEFMTRALDQPPEILAGRIENDPIALPADPEPTPTRIALDITGGNIQWAVCDRPVEFMVLDDELDRDCPGEAEPIMVNITDVDGVQTLAHKPGPMDLDPELVEHFFKQAR